jgi:hypothetical protein
MEIASGGGKKIEQLVCDLKFEGYNIVTVWESSKIVKDKVRKKDIVAIWN